MQLQGNTKKIQGMRCGGSAGARIGVVARGAVEVITRGLAVQEGGGAAGVEVAGGGVTRAEVVAGVEGVDLGADVAEAEVGVEGGLGTGEAVGLEWAVAAPLNAVVLGTLSPSGPYGQGLTPSQPRLMT